MGHWRDKRVVVTGAHGFLGSHVVAKLRAAGCAHLFAVRSQEYDLASEAGARLLFADLRAGRDGWPSGDGRAADLLVHLAGLVGGIGANQARPAEFFHQNLMMSVHTLHHAWRAGVPKVVAAGAGCGYPETAPLPLREASFWDGFPQAESAPYSLAKRMLHVQALAYGRQYGFPVIVTVPGNIYGPHDNFDLEAAHVMPALVRRFVEAVDDGRERVVVWGSGTPTRDFVYAGDVARGILRAAEVYERAELVNLATGVETSVRAVVETLVEVTGFDGAILWDRSRPDGQSRRLFDVTKARRELGFEARTTLRDGLARTVDWYRRHRAEARNAMSIEPVPGVGAGSR